MGDVEIQVVPLTLNVYPNPLAIITIIIITPSRRDNVSAEIYLFIYPAD